MNISRSNTYCAPAVKVIRVNAQNIICTSPTDDRTDGPASNEGFTEEQYNW